MDKQERDFDSCTQHDLSLHINSRLKHVQELNETLLLIPEHMIYTRHIIKEKEMKLNGEIQLLSKMREIMKEQHLYHWSDIYDA